VAPPDARREREEGLDRDAFLFGIPENYGSKVMRHSTATLLPNLGVPADQISTALGHDILGPLTRHYVTLQNGYLRDLRAGLEDLTTIIAKKARMPIRASSAQVGEDGRRRPVVQATKNPRFPGGFNGGRGKD
jgi:hypothetical protein